MCYKLLHTYINIIFVTEVCNINILKKLINFTLGTRYEDQKHIFNLVWPNKVMCSKYV